MDLDHVVLFISPNETQGRVRNKKKKSSTLNAEASKVFIYENNNTFHSYNCCIFIVNFT